MNNVVYIKHHPHSAGKWIYEGFARAWKSLGFNVLFFSDISQIKSNARFIMTTESDIENGIDILSGVEKSFVFVQPFKFPEPWGHHPNWITSVSQESAKRSSLIPSIKKWTFVNDVYNESYKSWGDVHYVPLAFDSLGYQLPDFNIEKKFDVCFVGGWADNGFNEKQKRIIDYLGPIQQSGIRCGFFINSGLTHDQENFVICSSRVALNIHDEYQAKLGMDLNERTFKSLAMAGILVSDSVSEIKNLLPCVKISNDPVEMLSNINLYLDLNESDLANERFKNRKMILDNHTYVNRVERMIQL
jgi:hypothetical protein